MHRNHEKTASVEPRSIGIKTLCVHCGSWSGRDPRLEDFARSFGSACAIRDIELIYRGRGVGLMGTVARAALAGGGRVVGIVPRSSMESELAYPGATELVVVDSLDERKQQMFERADGFVVLPGGLGTLAETIKMITSRQLRFHDKPIVLANYRGYWDSLLALFDHVVAAGFAGMEAHGLYAVAHSLDEVFHRLRIAAGSSLRAGT